MPLYGKLGDVYGRRIVLQVAVVIFLIGSALCGLAQNLPELIAFRILQGLGGGGLIVTAIAVVGDIVPPRERGRYQGFFGGVFGISTVLGPLLGGFIVDQSLLALDLLHQPAARPAGAGRHQRDVQAARAARPRSTSTTPAPSLLAIALTCIVLITSLGATLLVEAPVSLFAISLLAIAVARRASSTSRRMVPDPLLPLSLFRNRAFVLAAAIGFIVGMALFGSITLLPVYLQVVKGLDPTSAGLHLTPMMLGVFVTSIVSGQIITRIGRYKIFPVVGTALMTIGAGAAVAHRRRDLADARLPPTCCCSALGLGMVMQILVMAVQNAVAYEQLGVATSGTTLFRSIGGTVGAALFGGIFAYVLEVHLAMRCPASARRCATPTPSPGWPSRCARPISTLFVDALHPVFVTAAVLALISFFLALAIREVPLRTSIAPEPSATPSRCRATRHRSTSSSASSRASPRARTAGSSISARRRAWGSRSSRTSYGCWRA